ncbi:glycosyltransferase [Methylocaldum sp.]|uniref:glycosyltransferase n=1 Tax=Methylocaldum sp. TaxID=1969727 RepID=UPI002D6DE139|nr:glycosyltransferase [Methylocaldum sp.]HYE37375.1 glycosyltransferase [Methylocaldum sp.]
MSRREKERDVVKVRTQAGWSMAEPGRKQECSVTRILFVDFDLFVPPVTGARQRSALLHEALTCCGEVDTLVVFTQPRDISGDLSRMPSSYRLLGALEPPPPAGQTGLWRHLSPLNPPFIQKLAHSLRTRESLFRADGKLSAVLHSVTGKRRYDLIVARYLRNAAVSGILDFASTIIDVDDFDSELRESKSMMSGIPSWKRAMLLHYAEAYKKVETKLLVKCGGVFVTKETDLERVRGTRSALLSNIPYAADEYPDEPIPPAAGKTMVFVGGLRWTCNIEAVDFFIDKVWPEIRREVPDAVFRIIGAGLRDIDRQRWSRSEGVDVRGEVENIRDVYRDAAFSVAPILSGGGTNIKILESLLYNRTCVGTAFGMRGFENTLKNGISVSMVRNEREMAEACCRLLKNPTLAAWMAQNGRDIVRARFSREAFRSAVKKLVGEVLEETAPFR